MGATASSLLLPRAKAEAPPPLPDFSGATPAPEAKARRRRRCASTTAAPPSAMHA
jgi:hypothetical protein